MAIRRWPTRIAAILTIATAAGCQFGSGSSGSLRVKSLGSDPVALPSNYKNAVYSQESAAETVFLLTDIPSSDLLEGTVANGQILHVDLLWEPKPGRTPMDKTATNASIRFVIISGGEVGIYEGGGFATIGGKPGSQRVRVNLRDASLELTESTDGFTDLLTPAQMTGSFTARLDDTEARRLRFAASQFVTNVFGKTRFVNHGGTGVSPVRGLSYERARRPFHQSLILTSS